jgi:CBS domain-containing protein
MSDRGTIENVRVGDVMTRDVACVTAEMSLSELEAVLFDRNVSGAPVLEGAHVVGVVSMMDVLYLLHQAELDVQRMSAFYLGSFSISVPSVRHLASLSQPFPGPMREWRARDVMSTHVLGVSSSDRVETAAQHMIEHSVHRLLVIDDGILVGIVSAFDLLPVVAR